MAWHVIDPSGRLAGLGETEKAAWRAAEEHTDHELRDLLDAGYRSQFIGMSDRTLGWISGSIIVLCCGYLAWALWRYVIAT